MKHERILINVAAAVKGDSQLTARKTIRSVAQRLSIHGFKSLELRIAATLKDILGIHVDQTILPISDEDDDDMDFMPTYVSCLAKDDSLVFIDLELVSSKRGGKEREQNFLELDIFAKSLSDVRILTETLAALIAKFLKLPKHLEILRGATLVAQSSNRRRRLRYKSCPERDSDRLPTLA